MKAKPFSDYVKESDGCHERIGGRDDQGYGSYHNPDTGSDIKAHRYAYQTAVGPIPPGTLVRHTCDNPPCVRVDHLILGTDLDNVADMISRHRQNNQKKTHCPKGHEFSKENTYNTPCGRRQCMECNRESVRRYKAKKNASNQSV